MNRLGPVLGFLALLAALLVLLATPAGAAVTYDELLPWIDERYGSDAFLGDPELPASGSPAP